MLFGEFRFDNGQSQIHQEKSPYKDKGNKKEE
jgi:hypothetical protein